MAVSYNDFKKKYGSKIDDYQKQYNEIRKRIAALEMPSVTNQESFKKSKSYFDDGYQFGDITKTIGKTAINLPIQVAKGAASTLEGVIDTGASLGLGLAEWIDSLDGKIDKKENSDKIKQFIAEDQVDNVMKNLGWTDNLYNQVESGSLIKRDNLGGQIAEGIGGMFPSMLVGGTAPINKALSYGILGAKSFGGGTQEAFSNNASTADALKYGTLSAGAEIGSEFLTGGIPGLKNSKGLDDIVAKKLGYKTLDEVSGKLSKEILKAGYKMVGEAGEEALTEMINPLLKNLTYSKGEKINWNDVLNSAIVGGITGGILEAPENIHNFKTSTKRSQNNITNTSTQKITNRLSEKMPSYPNSSENNIGSANLNQSLLEGNLDISNSILSNDNITPYQYEKSDNPKINSLNESASKYFNNSENTKNLLNTYAKIISDKGYNIIFDDTITNNKNQYVNAQIKTLPDGDTEIKINPNSDRAGEFLIMHEVTHAIETNSMKELVLDYASKNNEFNQALESLKQTYGTDEVSSEVLADISGQLFGNQEFINDLSTKQPNIFKKIYNAIVSLANKITGNSKESLFIQDLKNKWEEAYRTQNNNLNNKVLYHTNANISSAIDNILNNINERNPIRLRDYTPKVLVNNGIKNLPMYENPSHVRKNILTSREAQELGLVVMPKDHYHGLGKDLYIRVIDSLDEPRVIFKNKNNKDYLVLTTIKDSQGNNIIVPIEIETTTNANNIKLDINRVKSVYGKGNLNNYIKRNINQKEFQKIYEQKKERGTGLIPAASSFSNDNISQSDGNVKLYTSSTKYSMQEDIKNTQELENSSFSLDSKAKRYDDLLKTNYIEYFRKDNGDVQVNLIDSNNNLVNQLDLWSNTYAIKQLGENLGNKIYETATDTNQRLDIGNDINNLGTDTDYFMNHRPSEDYGNASNFEENMPDIFEHPEWYLNLDEKYNKESLNALKKVRNKPEAELTIYRATIGNKINTGDWVTPSKSYAEYHNNSQFDGKGNILEMKVKAKDIRFAGDDINEFGYFPDGDIRLSQNNQTWQEYLEENYKSTGTRTEMNKIKKGSIAPKLTSQETRKITNEIKKETPIKKVNQKKIENNENAIKRLEQEKDALAKRIEDKIKQKQQLLNSKQNKDTKLSTQLNIQISNLINQLQNRKLDYDRRIEYYKNKNEKMNSKEFKIQEQRIAKKQEYIDQAYELTENMVDWKDKSAGIKYQINTMKRNMYDIMSKTDADRIYSTYFQPISENNARSEKFINSYNDRIKKLNLSNKESIAVQMLGEYKYNKETLITGPQLDQYISDNKLDYDKLSKAVEEFRNIYDELIVETNKVLKEQGYKEIEYRKGYFPHFQEEKPQSKFAKLAEKMGFKIDKNQLPTDIAGMTEIFKPGKTYFKNAQQRLGKVTDYNALKGFDNYIRGAADVIFHTEDIQKLRALETVIRTQYTDDAIRKNIESIANNNDYDQDQKQALIDLEFAKINNPLPNLVTELRNYTDSLANKKDIGDRGMEHMLGRETYTIMKNVQSRVSANMVGFNISSALTNFIPITQAWSQVSTKNMAKAIKESISNQFRNDGFDNCSSFLINRTKQAENLYKTKLDSINSKASIIFEAIDSITSNTVVRGKYYDNIDKGMSQEQAIKNANEFAKDIMAGRDKGSMPTIFNRKSPLVKLVTAFQLEVNNQYGYMLKDIPRDLGDEAKKKLVGAFIKMFVGAWLYNKFNEATTGRQSAFSPIDIVNDSIRNVTNDNLSTYDKISNITTELVGELPFIGGLLGGGRLPIQSAIPDIGVTAESITQLFDPESKKKAIKNLSKELTKPLFYVVMPFGGGQLKKTIEGASMYFYEYPGSYTSTGKLRFEAPTNFSGVAKSLIFGQYSSKSAQEYFDKGYAPLTQKQINEWQELNISLSEYRKYRTDLANLSSIKSDQDPSGKTIKGSASGKKAYAIMNNDTISNKEKNYLLDTLTSSASITVSDLQKIGNDEEIYQFFFKLNDKGRKTFIKDIEEKGFTSYQLVDFYTTQNDYQNSYVN